MPPSQRLRPKEGLMPTCAILKQIRSLGYAVSIHRINGVVEMHAVLLKDPSPDTIHIARSLDGNGPDDEYRTACALAEMVGIDLES
jgi:hypothetical protein